MFACAISTDEFKCFQNVLQANTHSMFVTRPVGLCQCLFPANSLTPVQSDQTARRGRGTFADTAIAHHERHATRCYCVELPGRIRICRIGRKIYRWCYWLELHRHRPFGMAGAMHDVPSRIRAAFTPGLNSRSPPSSTALKRFAPSRCAPDKFAPLKFVPRRSAPRRSASERSNPLKSSPRRPAPDKLGVSWDLA